MINLIFHLSYLSFLAIFFVLVINHVADETSLNEVLDWVYENAGSYPKGFQDIVAFVSRDQPSYKYRVHCYKLEKS